MQLNFSAMADAECVWGMRGLYSARKRRIWAMSASVRCVCGPAPGRPPQSGGGRLFGVVLVFVVDNVDVDGGDDDDEMKARDGHTHPHNKFTYICKYPFGDLTQTKRFEIAASNQ